MLCSESNTLQRKQAAAKYFAAKACNTLKRKQSQASCRQRREHHHLCSLLSSGETHEWHDLVHCTFINLMKIINEGTLIFGYQHQTIWCFDVVLVMKGCLLWWIMIIRNKIWYVHINIYMRIKMLHILFINFPFAHRDTEFLISPRHGPGPIPNRCPLFGVCRCAGSLLGCVRAYWPWTSALPDRVASLWCGFNPARRIGGEGLLSRLAAWNAPKSWRSCLLESITTLCAMKTVMMLCKLCAVLCNIWTKQFCNTFEIYCSEKSCAIFWEEKCNTGNVGNTKNYCTILHIFLNFVNNLVCRWCH